MEGILYTLAEEYLLYLQAEKGCNPLTASSYRFDLTQFFTHLQQVYQVTEPAGCSRLARLSRGLPLTLSLRGSFHPAWAKRPDYA